MEHFLSTDDRSTVLGLGSLHAVLSKLSKLGGIAEPGCACARVPLGELNFPVGTKAPLDLRDMRTLVATRLVDAIAGGFEPQGVEEARLLQRVRDAVRAGLAERALLRSPHVALADRDFYAPRLLPALGDWLLPLVLERLAHPDSLLGPSPASTCRREQQSVGRTVQLRMSRVLLIGLSGWAGTCTRRPTPRTLHTAQHGTKPHCAWCGCN